MDKEYYEGIFATVSNHILNPDVMDDGDKLYYQGLRKGYIVVDDESGKVLKFVKKSLRYEELISAGKVYEILVNDTWTEALQEKEQMSGREAWNQLIAAAYRANHGLLVIHITNIEIFGHCWKLKQLAKQENEMVAWSPESRSGITPLDCEFINQLIPERFPFDGNVLLVIDGLGWNRVKEYAKEHNAGEFDAMMQFYERVRIEE
jgi:hypothetical protein